MWVPKSPTRFVAVADNHGDMVDERTAEALFEFMDDYKPKIRVHLGDGFDFRALRRGADEQDQCSPLVDDWEQGADFVRRFFRGGEHNVYLEGNHCGKRLRDLQAHPKALIREFADRMFQDFRQLLERQCKCITRPYDSREGIYKLGKLNCLHGYFHGLGAARKHAWAYRNCIYGHTHTIESSPVESVDGPVEARGIGAICKLDMGYNNHKPGKLRQNNGWAYGIVNPDGSYQLFQTMRINDNFYAAKEIKKY